MDEEKKYGGKEERRESRKDVKSGVENEVDKRKGMNR